MSLLTRKVDAELAALREQVAEADREKEAAKLDLQRSVKLLRKHLKNLSHIDKAVEMVARDLAGDDEDKVSRDK